MFDDPIDFPKDGSKSKAPFDPEDFFDDCPICKAQEQAILEGRELTVEEFIQAERETFKKQP